MDTISTPQVSTSRTTWQLDPDHTNVEFAVKHLMMAKVKGRFADVQGTFELDELDPEGSSLSAVIHTASIDTRQKDRDGHLRSPDFLDVERFPTMTFESQRFERIERDQRVLFAGLQTQVETVEQVPAVRQVVANRFEFKRLCHRFQKLRADCLPDLWNTIEVAVDAVGCQ